MDLSNLKVKEEYRNIFCKSTSLLIRNLCSNLKKLFIARKNYQCIIYKILDIEIYIYGGFTNNSSIIFQ